MQIMPKGMKRFGDDPLDKEFQQLMDENIKQGLKDGTLEDVGNGVLRIKDVDAWLTGTRRKKRAK